MTPATDRRFWIRSVTPIPAPTRIRLAEIIRACRAGQTPHQDLLWSPDVTAFLAAVFDAAEPTTTETPF